MIDASATIRRNDRVEFRDLGEEGGAVLLHVGTGAYHGVNDVGALVWNILADGVAFGPLIDRLRSELEDVPATLSQEISEFLEELAERDLVAIEPAPAS